MISVEIQQAKQTVKTTCLIPAEWISCIILQRQFYWAAASQSELE